MKNLIGLKQLAGNIKPGGMTTPRKLTSFASVAHLYLGCNMLTEEGDIQILLGVEQDGIRISGDLDYFPHDSKNKPVLRPLDAMTEAEMNYLELDENDEFVSLFFKPDALVYLLSRHFDLFKLIEYGEALDATANSITKRHK